MRVSNISSMGKQFLQSTLTPIELNLDPTSEYVNLGMGYVHGGDLKTTQSRRSPFSLAPKI